MRYGRVLKCLLFGRSVFTVSPHVVAKFRWVMTADEAFAVRDFVSLSPRGTFATLQCCVTRLLDFDLQVLAGSAVGVVDCVHFILSLSIASANKYRACCLSLALVRQI